MPAIFTHRPSSPYDDEPGERYHFPGQYRRRIESVLGDWIAFHELKDRGRGANAYVSFARVRSIEDDPARPDHYYARLDQAGTFARPVPVGHWRSEVEGRFNPQNAVRLISTDAFLKLLDLADLAAAELDSADAYGVAEEQVPFNRDVEAVLRAKRAGWFRDRVLEAYDRRCALTGMRLINGGGATEVEAAHIRSVEHGGADLVQNGLALTRTVHWMFDRHLISLEDDLSLIRTPMLSDDARRFLGNVDRLRPPDRTADRPNAAFIAFHRQKTQRKARDFLSGTAS